MRKQIIFEGKETNYSVSDDGHVYNDTTGRELKGTYARNEYHSVQLVVEGRIRSVMVHRLVAEAFCENPNGYKIVDHINQNKWDNRAENLRWVSAKQNTKNATRKTTLVAAELAVLENEEYTDCCVNNNYWVTKSGKVINKKTKRILRGSLRNGYVRVDFGDHYYSVHRLIYESFVGPIPEKMVIDHIDGNRQNNCLSNLRMVTQSENAKSSYDRPRKGQVGVCQITSDGELEWHYKSFQEAADENGALQREIQYAANNHKKTYDYYWFRDDDESTTLAQFCEHIKGTQTLKNLI